MTETQGAQQRGFQQVPPFLSFRYYYLKYFIDCLEKEEGRDRKDVREKHQSAASPMPTTRDPAGIVGMCPDQESTGTSQSRGPGSIQGATPAGQIPPIPTPLPGAPS